MKSRVLAQISVRRVIAVASLGAVACAQLLGADDLRDRQPVVTTEAGSDGGSDGGAPACLRNRDCKREGEAPSLCVEQRCVPLGLNDKSTPICMARPLAFRPGSSSAEDRLTPEDDGDVLLVAGFLPLAANVELTGQALAYQLALREIEAGGGIPRGSSRARHVVMLLCESRRDVGGRTDIVTKGIEHVTRDLHPAAIVGAFSDETLTDVVRKVVQADRREFVINVTAPADALKYEPTEGLVLNLLGPASDIAVAYRPLLQRLETKLRTAGHVGPVKVAILVEDNPIDRELAAVLTLGPYAYSEDAGKRREPNLGLALNDAGPTENETAGTLKTISIASPVSEATYAGVRKQLEELQPDLVVALTQANVLERIVRDVEADGGADFGDGGSPVPLWLLGPKNARAVLPYFVVGGTNPSPSARNASDRRQRRFFGVQYANTTEPTSPSYPKAQRTLWLDRMRNEYPQVDVDAYQSLENYYDALYWIAYGLAASGTNQPAEKSLGDRIALGVTRMYKDPIAAGAGIPVVNPPAGSEPFIKLQQSTNGTVFVGAQGLPDIDSRFGTWRSKGGVYCYANSADASGPINPEVRYDALRHLADGGFLEPDLNACPWSQ